MSPENYEKIKNTLGEEYGLYLDKDEIDLILRVALREKTESQNIGIRPERCKDNSREMAFHKGWLKENKIDAGLNFGNGTLQGLFTENRKNAFSPIPNTEYLLEITPRERMIVATVIQWLGSNVGFCFLQETLKDCGYQITPIPNDPKSQT